MDIFSKTGVMSLPPSLTNLPKLVMTADGSRIDGKLFLTSVQCSGDSNIQVDQTFNGDVYITSFGEKLTVANVSGVVVTFTCPSVTEATGSMRIVDLYKKYRAGTAKRVPVIKLSYAGNVFTGFLTGIKLAPYQSEVPLPAYAFTLTVFGKFL